MRTCPFHGCNAEIPAERFACRKHWFALGPCEKRRLMDAYDAWQRGEMSGQVLRLIQQEVLGERGTVDKPLPEVAPSQSSLFGGDDEAGPYGEGR